MSQPEIHTWWPFLSANAKDVLDDCDGSAVPDLVREEVEQITGSRMLLGQRLSDADRAFIRTQREAVD